MVYFQTKNPNFGQIWECLAMKDVGKFCSHLVHFSAISYILCPFGIFCGHLVHFVVIWYILRSFWYIFPRFGMLYQEKSGNPALQVYRANPAHWLIRLNPCLPRPNRFRRKVFLSGLRADQCDQMNLSKIAQNVAQPVGVKKYLTF
jgi:hypothetical protein